MARILGSTRPTGALALLAALTLSLLLAASAAADTTIQFGETEKGQTFSYVDNAPKSELKHGFPTQISAGDEIAMRTPLVEGGKTIGHLIAHCTATETSKSFDGAGFLCHGAFELPGGTLFADAIIAGPLATEGAIVGGTGRYAGAHGTFTTKETKGPVSPVTVTLDE